MGFWAFSCRRVGFLRDCVGDWPQVWVRMWDLGAEVEGGGAQPTWVDWVRRAGWRFQRCAGAGVAVAGADGGAPDVRR